ncbi:hypothetical protein COJ48_30745 [Bacillus cereus]|nr:hypothetical protein COJ48_30745 [Bacillus cereus]
MLPITNFTSTSTSYINNAISKCQKSKKRDKRKKKKSRNVNIKKGYGKGQIVEKVREEHK